MNQVTSIKFYIILSLFVILIPSAYANIITQEPISIESASAIFNNKTGIATYTGNVIIKRGGACIKGDISTLYTDKKRHVTRLVVRGKLAYFVDKINKKDKEIQAWGQSIHYDVIHSTVALYGQAKLKQNNSTFEGDKINYDIKNEVISASGNKAENKNKKNHRIKIIIQPDQKKIIKSTS